MSSSGYGNRSWEQEESYEARLERENDELRRELERLKDRIRLYEQQELDGSEPRALHGGAGLTPASYIALVHGGRSPGLTPTSHVGAEGRGGRIGLTGGVTARSHKSSNPNRPW